MAHALVALVVHAGHIPIRIPVQSERGLIAFRAAQQVVASKFRLCQLHPLFNELRQVSRIQFQIGGRLGAIGECSQLSRAIGDCFKTGHHAASRLGGLGQIVPHRATRAAGLQQTWIIRQRAVDTDVGRSAPFEKIRARAASEAEPAAMHSVHLRNQCCSERIQIRP